MTGNSFHKGERDLTLKESIKTAFLLIAIVALFLTLLPILALDTILSWMNIPQEILSLTREYLFIIFCGIPAVFLYNFFAACLKALGNSVVPLVFLGISTAVNIALDLLFVMGMGWGTSGAAGATILVQYCAGIGKPAMSLVLTIISLGTRVVLACLLSSFSFIGVTGRASGGRSRLDGFWPTRLV